MSLRGLILAIGALVLFCLSIVAGYWFYRSRVPLEDQLVLKQVSFDDLPGWTEDDLTDFLPAFFKSCNRILALPEKRLMGGAGIGGTAADWQPLCHVAQKLPPNRIKDFFQQNMTPFHVLNNNRETGLFTGYYEASLKGSRTRHAPYLTPLYLRPPELVTVDLGQFRDDLKGRRIAGEVVDGALVPYPDRTEIEEGALKGRNLELVWVDSPIDAFFLHIQGSGVVQMDDGTTLRVGYAAQNGHPYYAIGRALIDEGEVKREDMSMQAIRDWMEAHPDKAADLMRQNPSYVFFRRLDGDGPVGAEGVELTPERSLAVDRKWMPLGVPLWLSTTVTPQNAPADAEPVPFRHLMMAQDTGGAITGPVRGDVFWGYGPRAYHMAGGMKNDGELWILLPNALATRLISDSQS